MTLRALVLLMLAAATLLAAANVGVGWLYALGFLFLGYFLIAYGTSYWALRNLQVTLRPAERSEAGHVLPCVIALRARDGRSRRFLSLLAQPIGQRGLLPIVRGRLIPPGWAHGFVQELPAGPGILETLSFPTPRRGVFKLPPLVIQSPAMGLGAWHRRFEGGHEVLVHPRVIQLPRLAWLDPVGAQEGRATNLETGTDLIRSVRDYRSGDSMRSVHWRSTARNARLMVKELEGEYAQGSYSLGLDLGPGHSDETFEHALSLAASLCVYARANGMSLSLFSQSGAPTNQTLAAQLDWLSRLEGPATTPWSSELQEASVLVTPSSRAMTAGRVIFVGKGPAPSGMISCPPGSDVAALLGAAHG